MMIKTRKKDRLFIKKGSGKEKEGRKKSSSGVHKIMGGGEVMDVG